MTGDFVLTDANYYTPEADMVYMSCSQYQSFEECEAKALAKLQGRWKDEPTEAFLVGNYFHSHFEGEEAHKAFCDHNFDEIFKTKTKMDRKTGYVTVEITGKYSPYVTADRMIEALESDEVMQKFINMPGNHEQFMTGEIWGVPWRMKMDKYVPDERYILDYKTTRNIWETSYNPRLRQQQSFVESYGYIFRAAVYSMIEMQNVFSVSFDEAFANLSELSDLPLPNFLLLCVSKQDPPDKDIIRLNHKQAYAYELERIKNRLAHFQSIKEGRVLPRRCGQCAYCRSTKKIMRIRPYYELSPEFRAAKNELEEDYCADISAISSQT